jgi:hypothetical protein
MCFCSVNNDKEKDTRCITTGNQPAGLSSGGHCYCGEVQPQILTCLCTMLYSGSRNSNASTFNVVTSSKRANAVHFPAVQRGTFPSCSIRYISHLFNAIHFPAVHRGTFPSCSMLYISQLFNAVHFPAVLFAKGEGAECTIERLSLSVTVMYVPVLSVRL